MKVYEFLEKTSENVIICESYFDNIIGFCDGKNGVSYPILNSEIGRISYNSKANALMLETDFNVYDFLKENFDRLGDKIIDDFINYNDDDAIVKLDIEYLFSSKGSIFYSIGDNIYNARDFYENIVITNEHYIKRMLEMWSLYEEYLDLNDVDKWGF